MGGEGTASVVRTIHGRAMAVAVAVGEGELGEREREREGEGERGRKVRPRAGRDVTER